MVERQVRDTRLHLNLGPRHRHLGLTLGEIDRERGALCFARQRRSDGTITLSAWYQVLSAERGALFRAGLRGFAPLVFVSRRQSLGGCAFDFIHVVLLSATLMIAHATAHWRGSCRAGWHKP